MTIKLQDKYRRSLYVQIGIVSWGKGCAEASESSHDWCNSFNIHHDTFVFRISGCIH